MKAKIVIEDGNTKVYLGDLVLEENEARELMMVLVRLFGYNSYVFYPTPTTPPIHLYDYPTIPYK